MKEWAFSICLAVISGCIIKIISPNSGLGKMINFSISILLLSCLFSGFILKNPNLEPLSDIIFESKDIEDKLKSLSEEKTLGIAENKLKQMIENDLIMIGLTNIKISININTNDKSSILINQIEIWIPKEESQHESKIMSIIEEKYKIIPNIIYN